MKSAPDNEQQPLEIEPRFVGLRPASESGRAFCYDVKKAAIGPYVAEIWGWDEAFQRQFHRDDYAATRPDIVVFRGLDIGTFKITTYIDHLHLGEFYLLPQFQRQGIGTVLLERMRVEASAQGLAVRLEVLKNNPVQSLYRRHGFAVSGQREHHFLMERPAP